MFDLAIRGGNRVDGSGAATRTAHVAAFDGGGRGAGPKMPLEHVIHRQTRQIAELCGLADRGPLATGRLARGKQRTANS